MANCILLHAYSRAANTSFQLCWHKQKLYIVLAYLASSHNGIFDYKLSTILRLRIFNKIFRF